MAGNFDVMKCMGERNMNIKAFPLSNLKSARSGKDGLGVVEIVVDQATVLGLLNGKKLIEKELDDASQTKENGD